MLGETKVKDMILVFTLGMVYKNLKIRTLNAF